MAQETRSPAGKHMFPKRRQAFTLVELMVVISIIVVLSALLLGAIKGVQTTAARNRARGEIQAFESALERYKMDNGDYPGSVAPTNSTTIYDPNPSNYTTNSLALYRGLTGKSTTNYVANVITYMDIKSSSLKTDSGGNVLYILDPFKNPYGYAANANAYYNANGVDIWSTGGGTTASDVESWITNWKSQ